jgi:hypothetical protein
MHLLKKGKYQLGKKSLDKSVTNKRERSQESRAFIKCIFAKKLGAANADFEYCKLRYGNDYEMDHTYRFYIGLSYL